MMLFPIHAEMNTRLCPRLSMSKKGVIPKGPFIIL